jgi:hypothetical protein
MKAFKPSQTTSNNHSLEGFKSTNVPLGSSFHDVNYRNDEDSMFMVGTQSIVATIFLLDQIKVVVVGCKNTRKGFWSQDEKFGKLGSKV